MLCECGGRTEVVDSRSDKDNRVRRRRQCYDCGSRFSTVEIAMDHTAAPKPKLPSVGLNRDKMVRNASARRKLEEMRDNKHAEDFDL